MVILFHGQVISSVPDHALNMDETHPREPLWDWTSKPGHQSCVCDPQQGPNFHSHYLLSLLSEFLKQQQTLNGSVAEMQGTAMHL